MHHKILTIVYLFVLTGMGFTLSGCGIGGLGKDKKNTSPTEPSQNGVTTDQYNKLVNDYNNLLEKSEVIKNQSYTLDLESRKQSELILSLDEKFSEIFLIRNTIESEFKNILDFNKHAQIAQYSDNLVESTKSLWTALISATNLIGELERSNLRAYEAFLLNSEHVYKNPEAMNRRVIGFKDNFRQRGNQLSGFRMILSDLREEYSIEKQVQRLSQVIASLDNSRGSSVEVKKDLEEKAKELARSNQRRVNLTEREQNVSRHFGAARSQGRMVGTRYSRQGQQEVITGSKDEFVKLGTDMGFNRGAVEHGFDISLHTGGTLGFATSKSDIQRIITDNYMADIKEKMNQNQDNLELVLVLDYSGSMSDKIEGVIQSLIEFSKSLEAIRTAGRSVRVGIVTFGRPGLEKVNLDLTENLNTVQEILAALYKNYRRDQHSIEPGEAIYYGLNEAATSISWRSRNKAIILVTDEPSYAIMTGKHSFVEQVKERLRSNGIQTQVYTLLTKRFN